MHWPWRSSCSTLACRSSADGKELDKWGKFEKDNDAVGIAIVIAISTIVSHGVSRIIAAIFA